LGAQYWKNSKSFIPVAEEDGIVGLTFSPSGEMNSLTHHSYTTGSNNKMQPRVNQLNDFNNDQVNYDHPTKDGLFHHHIKGGKGGESSASASCSSSSSNAGDTSSSCGSTAASSVRVTSRSRRSRTFQLALPSLHRTNALIRKNFMQTFRNIG